MTDSITEPKRHLALDTDWASAVAAACSFVICALLGTATTWMILRGHFGAASPSWWTLLLAGSSIYCGISISDKFARTAVFVFAIGPISRVILWFLRASAETRWTNEIFVRWIDTVLYFGVCIYVVFWFTSKVRRV
jgi:hypothetical protein